MSDIATDPPSDATDTNELKQVRDYADGLEKRVKELEKANKGLSEFRETAVQTQRESVFSSLEMNERQRSLFLKDYEGDTFDADTVKTWAGEAGIQLGGAQAPPPEPAPASPGLPGFSPAQVAGGQPAMAGQVTMAQLDEIGRKNIDEAFALIRDGKVKWRDS